MPRAKRADPVVEAEPDEQLDQSTETDTLSGAIPEGVREILRPIVSKMGWAPKEDWKRDPAEWRDELQFLEQTPEVITRLKEQGERQARAAAAAIEEERSRKAEEATRIIRESDDPKIREAAAQSLRESVGPPPQTVAWMAKNPWFDSDPEAKQVAVRAIQRGVAIGLSIEDQLAAGEEAAKRVFPQYFSAGTEQRLSDVRRQAPTPPQVQEGSRATASQPKEKGWAEVPRADREAFERHLLKAFMSKGQTREQAQAKYAESYWREGVLPPNEREEDPWVREKKTNPWGRR